MGTNNEWPVRPVVVASRCLGFEHCRYNGQMVRDPLVEALQPLVDFITPCPEKDIGLGVPRHPVRIVKSEDENRLQQMATGEDATERMNAFLDTFMEELEGVDGFILKSRSPSCGLFDVKHYPPGEKKPPLEKGAGMFGERVLNKYSDFAVEDEARLSNHRIRHHFLTKLFTLADYRRVEETGRARDLVDFQARNKLLFMAYSQKEMREMGRIVAHQDETGLKTAMEEYRAHLHAALSKGIGYRSNINVLEHAFGYVTKELGDEERAFFLDNLEMFREDRTPLITLLNILRAWILRFDVQYLREQTYFRPYPLDLQRKFSRYRSKEYWDHS